MSWQWPNTGTQTAAAATAATPAAATAGATWPNVGLTPGTSYTPEQWAAMQQNWQQWTQWQQQYAQWQQQYGAEYQKQLEQQQAAAAAAVQPPLPTEPPPQPSAPTVIGPVAPVEQKPPLPPPLPNDGSNNSSNVAAGNYNTAAANNQFSKPPPLITNYNQGQNSTTGNDFNNRNSQFNANNRGGNTNQQWGNRGNRGSANYKDQTFNQQQNRFGSGGGNQSNSSFSEYTKPPAKRPFDHQGAQQNEGFKRNRWESGSSDGNNEKSWYMHDDRWNEPKEQKKTPTKPAGNEELSEAEKNFDVQFAQWEAQFNKWKEQNSAHPDKQQYKEYEAKWEAWKTQLLERREQMRKKRLGLLTGTTPIKPTSTLPPTIPPLYKSSSGGKDTVLNSPTGSTKSTLPPSNQQPQTPTPSEKNTSSSSRWSNAEKEDTSTTVFSQPPPTMNNAPLEFKKYTPTAQINESPAPKEQRKNIRPRVPPPTTTFVEEKPEIPDLFSKSTQDGIPGLDLIPDEKEPSMENHGEVIDLDESPKKPSVNNAPDFAAISRGIDNILGDKKFLDMLSMVSKNQKPTGPGGNTTAPSELANNSKIESQPRSNYQGEQQYSDDRKGQYDNACNRQQENQPPFSRNDFGGLNSNFQNNFNNRWSDQKETMDKDFRSGFNPNSMNPNPQGSFSNQSGDFDQNYRKTGQQRNLNNSEEFNQNNMNQNRQGGFNNQSGGYDQDDRKMGQQTNFNNSGAFNQHNINQNQQGSFNNQSEGFGQNDRKMDQQRNFNNSGVFNQTNMNKNQQGSFSQNEGFGQNDRKMSQQRNFNNSGGFNQNNQNQQGGFKNENEDFDPNDKKIDQQSNFNNSERYQRRFDQNVPQQQQDSFNQNSNMNFNQTNSNFNSRNPDFDNRQTTSTFNKNDSYQNEGMRPFSYNRDMKDPEDFDNGRAANQNSPFGTIPNDRYSEQDRFQRTPLNNRNDKEMGSMYNMDNRRSDFNNSRNFGDNYNHYQDNFDSNSNSGWADRGYSRFDSVNDIEKENYRLEYEKKRYAWDEGEFLKPEVVIDYNHKSVKNTTIEPELFISPIQTFDYRHMPITRFIGFKPKWLLDSLPQQARSMDRIERRPYPQYERHDNSSERFGRYPRNISPDNSFGGDKRPIRESRDRLPKRQFSSNKRESRPSENIFDEIDQNSPDSFSDPDLKNKDNDCIIIEDDDDDVEVPPKKESNSFNPSSVVFQSRFGTQMAHQQISNNIPIKIEDLLVSPGRNARPPRIAIILRGPPGSGKTFLAKLIKDKEVEQGGSAPRILSLDDYFTVEQEKELKEDGRTIKVKEMVYEYEEEMEGSYMISLLKSFKKTITDGYFSFIIIDSVFDKVAQFAEIWSFAKQKGFQVYVCQMELDAHVCHKRNIHNRTEEEIEKLVKGWETTPSHILAIDPTSLIQDGSINEVEMEEINETNVADNDMEEDQAFTSKWDNFEFSGENLAKLDGTSKPLRHSTKSMEDYLQLDSEPVWNPEPLKPGQKRVRWADLEERREQEKMRAIGFVVGQTDWDRMMDPTMGSRALTQTKYIERVRRY